MLMIMLINIQWFYQAINNWIIVSTLYLVHYKIFNDQINYFCINGAFGIDKT